MSDFRDLIMPFRPQLIEPIERTVQRAPEVTAIMLELCIDRKEAQQELDVPHSEIRTTQAQCLLNPWGCRRIVEEVCCWPGVQCLAQLLGIERHRSGVKPQEDEIQQRLVGPGP